MSSSSRNYPGDLVPDPGAGEGDLASFGYKQELRRSLTTTDLLVYGLVFMVPIAPWAIYGTVFNTARAWCRSSTSSASSR